MYVPCSSSVSHIHTSSPHTVALRTAAALTASSSHPWPTSRIHTRECITPILSVLAHTHSFSLSLSLNHKEKHYQGEL
eukprot:c21094_g1_i1 orf=196-429(+)